MENSRLQVTSLNSKLVSSDGQVAALTSKLKCSDSLCHNIQTKYTQLLGVLEGTLGFIPVDDNEPTIATDLHVTDPDSPAVERPLSPTKPKECSFDSSGHFSFSLAESGVGASITSPSVPLHSSTADTQVFDTRCKNRSPTKLVLDTKLSGESHSQFAQEANGS